METRELRQHELLNADVDETLHASLHIIDGAEEDRTSGIILT